MYSDGVWSAGSIRISEVLLYTCIVITYVIIELMVLVSFNGAVYD